MVMGRGENILMLEMSSLHHPERPVFLQRPLPVEGVLFSHLRRKARIGTCFTALFS